MHLNHRYLEQVKQADRLDQNGTGTRLAVVHLTSTVMKLVDATSLHPPCTRWRASAYGSVKRNVGTGKLSCVFSSEVDTTSREPPAYP
jgi:hypothetical protein